MEFNLETPNGKQKYRLWLIGQIAGGQGETINDEPDFDWKKDFAIRCIAKADAIIKLLDSEGNHD